MYNAIHDSMFEGSLYGKGPLAQALWAYVLSKMRPDKERNEYYVDLNPTKLKDTIGKVTGEEVAREILKFCSAEEDSASGKEKGKKLVREGQFLYRVVNAAAYQKLRDAEARRVYQREYMKNRRAAKKGQPLPGERTGEQPHEWRTGPGGDLDEPPVETVDHLPDTGKVMVPVTNQSATSSPRGGAKRNDTRGTGRVSYPGPVQSTEPPVEETLAAAEIEDEQNRIAQSGAPSGQPVAPAASSATLQGQPNVRAGAPISRGARATPKTSRPPLPPSPATANASTVAAIRGNSGGPVPGVSRAALGGPQGTQSGASVRPAPGPRKAGEVLAGMNLPKPAPVNPNQLDRMPRTEAGVIAGTGQGSAFGGWEERTVTPKPPPK